MHDPATGGFAVDDGHVVGELLADPRVFAPPPGVGGGGGVETCDAPPPQDTSRIAANNKTRRLATAKRIGTVPEI